MLEPRSTEKIAALSVAATIEPMSIPSSIERSSSHAAVSPTPTAVRIVPANASERLVDSTGRISPQPALRPPSKRISATAMMPIVWASSTSSMLVPKSSQPSPSEPISIPRPRNSTRPGTPSRPATRVATMPSASSAPATRISVPTSKPRESMVRPSLRPIDLCAGAPCRSWAVGNGK